jgi:hypothetical protein
MKLLRAIVAWLFTRLHCQPSHMLPRCYLHGHLAMLRIGRTGHYCAFCLEKTQ